MSTEIKKLISLKKETKKKMFQKCGEGEINLPLLIVFAPEKGDLKGKFYQLLEGLLVLPLKIVILSKERGDTLCCPSGKMTWISCKDEGFNELCEEYLLAADMALVFEGNHRRLIDLFKKGLVIIGRKSWPLLENYHPNNESGNSFTYESDNPWEIFRALVRAHETYRFPYDWENIIRTACKDLQRESVSTTVF
jgi:hypothetical protein